MGGVGLASLSAGVCTLTAPSRHLVEAVEGRKATGLGGLGWIAGRLWRERRLAFLGNLGDPGQELPARASPKNEILVLAAAAGILLGGCGN